MDITYDFAKYIRLGERSGEGVEVKTYTPLSRSSSRSLSGFALIVEGHNLDWSREDSSSFSNTGILQVTGIASEELEQLIVEGEEIMPDSRINNCILSAYQKAHVEAQAAKIAASLLSIVWLKQTLYLASVGICRCYLIRNGSLKQINIDDYNRISIGDRFHTSSSILSNVIGMGRIESIHDIHLYQHGIEPQDILVLCNEAFHKNIPEDQIIDAALSNLDVEQLCGSLGEKARQRSDSADSIALCIVEAI
jgi:serine/threonine protein phosphatase PrpC